MGAQSLSSREIIGEFYKVLEQDEGMDWVSGISMFFESDQASETYNWLGQAPAMREWVGGRHAKGFTENGITIANLSYEATLEVLIDDLRRDKSGQVLVRIAEMARRTNAHWAKLLTTLIINGESTACYDGQFFFDTDHSEGDSGTQDNDLSIDISALPVAQHGSITAPSPEEMEQCILQAISQIISFLDDQGEPMNENASDFQVIVPISLLNAAHASNTARVLDSGKTNQLMSSGYNLSVHGNARLDASWTDQFAVFRRNAGGVGALIRQQETAVTLDAIAEGSELAFNEKKHNYGVDTNRNVGYGFWQHACLVTMV